ncbi:MAG: hypothetical protein JNG90_12535 [Planctomycetaceae bacterium]|nr:hypothetical protein [Planctomycetaceae bacterium]
MATPFEELAGSPTIHFRDGSFTAMRRLLVAWDDALPFLVELYGGWRLVGDELSVDPPSHFPGVPAALVTDITVEPFPPDSPNSNPAMTLASAANGYDRALLTVTYDIVFDLDNRARRDLPAVPAGTYLTYRGAIGLESVATPGRIWKWAVDATAVGDDVRPAIITPTEEFTLTWYRVPQPPWDAIRDLRGRVNDNPFLNFAAGTVLFLGVETKRDFQVLDAGMWRLAYRFKVRTVPSTATAGVVRGWNHHYRRHASASEHWLEIADQDNHRPYAAGSFAELFRFEP